MRLLLPLVRPCPLWPAPAPLSLRCSRAPLCFDCAWLHPSSAPCLGQLGCARVPDPSLFLQFSSCVLTARRSAALRRFPVAPPRPRRHQATRFSLPVAIATATASASRSLVPWPVRLSNPLGPSSVASLPFPPCRHRHTRPALSCEATQTRVALVALLAVLLATAAALGLVGLWLSDGGPLGRDAALPVAAAAAGSLAVLLLVAGWWLGTVRWLRRDRSHLLRSTYTRHLYGIFGDESSSAASAAPKANVDVQALDEEAAFGIKEYCSGLADMCLCCCTGADEGQEAREDAPLLGSSTRASGTDTLGRVRTTVKALRAAAQRGDTEAVLHLLGLLAQEPMTVEILQKTGEPRRWQLRPVLFLKVWRLARLYRRPRATPDTGRLPRRTGAGVIVNFLQGPVEEPAQRLVASWRTLASPAVAVAATPSRGRSPLRLWMAMCLSGACAVPGSTCSSRL